MGEYKNHTGQALADLLISGGVEAWNKYREAKPDWKADLSEANLYEADLRGADLRRADLRSLRDFGSLEVVFRPPLSGV